MLDAVAEQSNRMLLDLVAGFMSDPKKGVDLRRATPAARMKASAISTSNAGNETFRSPVITRRANYFF